MPLNIIDESTLTVAGTSIGLSSASPTLAASITNGARQAIIIVKTAAVHYREDGDAATTSDAILYPDDILQVGGGDEALQILDKIRFIRNSSTSGELIIKWYNRERIATAKVIRGTRLAASTAAIGKVGHDKTGIADNRKTVATAATRETLVASTTAATLVIITAETDNTGVIVVGGSTVVAALGTRRGTPLSAGESVALEVDDLVDVYLDTTVNGDGVTFTYLT